MDFGIFWGTLFSGKPKWIHELCGNPAGFSLSPWPPSGSAIHGLQGRGFTAEGAVCWIPPNQIRPKYDMVGCSHDHSNHHQAKTWCITMKSPYLILFYPIDVQYCHEKTINPPWKSPWNRHEGPTSSRWKMPAASAASASPTARASSKCSGQPAPLLAITGNVQADFTWRLLCGAPEVGR